MKPSNEIVKQETQLLQMAKINDIKKWYNDFVKLSKDVLKDGLDFGTIPGIDKPALLKPGAEKLRFVYGLQTKTERTDFDIDTEQDYIDYTYKTTVLSPDGTRVLAECEGNCNSLETKFRYVWVKEEDIPEGVNKDTLKSRKSSITEFDFAINKGETTGQYGKPQKYWDRWRQAISSGEAVRIQRRTSKGTDMAAWEMGSSLYRIENPEIMGYKNTIMKMAQKRSFVGAMLMATGASEFFTQDVEEMDIPIDDVDILKSEAKAPAQADQTVEKPKSKPRATRAKTVTPEKNPVEEAEIVEGELVDPEDEPAQEPEPTDPNERIRLAKVKWVEALVKDGKLERKDYRSMSIEELIKVMDDYRSTIGK